MQIGIGRKEVINLCFYGMEPRTCMEHVLNDLWKQQEWDGTFLYGGSNDGPFVYDFVHGTQITDQHGRLAGLAPIPSRPAR